MTTTTIKIKDKRRRIYIPEDVWDAERLKVGDYVQLDVKRVDAHDRPEEGKR